MDMMLAAALGYGAAGAFMWALAALAHSPAACRREAMRARWCAAFACMSLLTAGVGFLSAL
jgi:hypothetical protein